MEAGYFRCKDEVGLSDMDELRDLITEEIYNSGMGMKHDRLVITGQMQINTSVFEEAEIISQQ